MKNYADATFGNRFKVFEDDEVSTECSENEDLEGDNDDLEWENWWGNAI